MNDQQSMIAAGHCVKPYRLYYFSRRKNLGDELNRDILRYMGIDYTCVNLEDCNLLAIGSLLSASQGIVSDTKPDFLPDGRIDVWGTGFIEEQKSENEFFTKRLNIRALRGKLSRSRSEAALGCRLDEIALGDPGLLTSRAIRIDNAVKKYDVGIIPHYVDRESGELNNVRLRSKSFTIIDVQQDVQRICREMNECRLILSSALHGLIVADSYGIPNRWIRMSDSVIGGDYKFDDYYSVFDLEGIKPVDLRKEVITDGDIDTLIVAYSIPKDRIERICDDLEKAFPGKNRTDAPEDAAFVKNMLDRKSRAREQNRYAIECFNAAVESFYNGDFRKAKEIVLGYKSAIRYDSFPGFDKRYPAHPQLSIVIVAWNTTGALVRCVESVAGITDGRYEIIVVDNGGNESVLEKLLDFNILYICSPHNFGPSEGRNIGASCARGNIVAFLDDDSVAGDNFASSVMESCGRYNIIGLRGRVLPKTEQGNHQKAAHYHPGDTPSFVRHVNVEGNSAFRKDEYFRLKGMDPLLFGHEGIDLSYRIEKLHGPGKILYSPETVIFHDFASSEVKAEAKAKRYEWMLSYLKSIYPDVEAFMADDFRIDVPVSSGERMTTWTGFRAVRQEKPRLIMTLLVRDEEDIIRTNLEHHLKNGVDYIIATDNASVDSTRNILLEYQQTGKLHLIDEPGRDKSQAAWNNRMARIAVERYGADAVFHCDADEFWCPLSGDLKTEIFNSSCDVQSVSLINVILENHDGEEVFPKDAKYAVVAPFEGGDYEWETKYTNLYYYRYIEKVIFKTQKGCLEVDQGNHHIVHPGVEIRQGASENIIIFHFPIRDKKRFYAKVIQTGQAVERNKLLESHQSFHIRRWYDAYRRGCLDQEYEKLTVTRNEAGILKEKGMLADFDFTAFLDNWMREEYCAKIQRHIRGKELQKKDLEILLMQQRHAAQDERIAALNRRTEEESQRKNGEISHWQNLLAERDSNIAGLQQRIEEELRQKDSEMERLRHDLTESREQIENLHEAFAGLQQRMEEESRQKDSESERLRQALTESGGRIEHLSRLVGDRENDIRHIFSSTSWRVTAPMRRLKTLIQAKKSPDES